MRSKQVEMRKEKQFIKDIVDFLYLILISELCKKGDERR